MNNIRAFIGGIFKMRQIDKKTKWNRVPITGNDDHAISDYIAQNKQAFIADINTLNDWQNPTLIPIIMFNNESIDYSIEHVWDLKIRDHLEMPRVFNQRSLIS